MFLAAEWWKTLSDPDSPWYYIIGAGFLVLIFIAIAVFVAVSKKKNKDSAEQPTEPVDNAEETQTTEQEKKEPEKTEKEVKESEPQAEEEAKEQVEAAPQEEVKEEKAEEPIEEPVEEKVAEEEPAKEPEQPVATEENEPEQPVEKAEEQVKEEAAEEPVDVKPTKKAPVKRNVPQKPFIERLIAQKSAHGIYNELKNTILSYPGMKAKLTKTDEQFFFGQDKKAAIELDGEKITLFLSIDPKTVPSQFTVDTAKDLILPTKVEVAESKIDTVQRLIVYAMNVSMLTRNDKHRRVDYIQKAIDAQNRAKKK